MCFSIDYWLQEGKLIAQMPTFSEDFTFDFLTDMALKFCETIVTFLDTWPCITYKMVIKTPEVQFSLCHSSIMKDMNLVPGTGQEIFFTLVTHTQAEFLYQTQKVC